MTQLTPRDNVRKEAGEILKRVDQLIKSGEIDLSVREIMRAKEIDPSNIYVHAYEERLAFLKEEHEKNIVGERTRKEAEEAARKRDAGIRHNLEEEQRRHNEELERQTNERKQQEKQKIIEQERSTVKVSPPSLTELPSSDAAETVYVEAFKKAWSTGNIIPQQAVALQKLREELGISSGRQLQIDARLLSELQSKDAADTILVVDDDEQMLLLISQILTYHGYLVTALTTSDEAYMLLKKWKPRLILSDINLETSTMGGFSFYEKIRELQHLHNVPFVFLTGLSDAILVRTGKELGVDDYLTKPISEENLVATVKGKLKRFRGLGEQSSLT